MIGAIAGSVIGALIGHAEQPLSWFGLPTDALGWGAGLCGIVLSWPAVGRRVLAFLPGPWCLPLLALLSALLSTAYFQLHLGGQPRIIDASTYLLEARTFASGHFSFAVSEVSALFRGRFLLPHPDQPTLAPIFPPGYPALLSLFVRLGDYRLLGPTLAVAITLATAWLGFLVTKRRTVALLAATFSVLSAALRYHTADTMSHGWSILLATLALAASVQAQRAESRPNAVPSALLGFWLGGLAATRPLTAAAVGAACLLPLVVTRRRALAWHWLGLGLAPGLCLLALHNHALTGSALGSPQLAYYALADGPAGCFRLGLGAGCRVEHADVVQAQGGRGLTVGWMIRNTLHRLHWHALDLANCELLLPLAWYYLARRWKKPSTRALSCLVLLLPAAYAFFYFQGSYPGGGARFFSELLPALHVALSAGLLALGWARLGLALALLGYAGHAAHVHAALPGAPPLQTEPTPEGLRAVSSDHAFNLLFVPGRIESGRAPTVVRATHDARRWAPRGAPAAAQLEAEADWPVRDQAGAWTETVHLPDPCVSGGRALRIHPEAGVPGAPTFVELELAGLPPGRYALSGRLWSSGEGCRQVPLGDVTLPQRHQLFLAELRGGAPAIPLHLDRLDLRPLQ
jgi:hypothetical protein